MTICKACGYWRIRPRPELARIEHQCGFPKRRRRLPCERYYRHEPKSVVGENQHRGAGPFRRLFQCIPDPQDGGLTGHYKPQWQQWISWTWTSGRFRLEPNTFQVSSDHSQRKRCSTRWIVESFTSRKVRRSRRQGRQCATQEARGAREGP